MKGMVVNMRNKKLISCILALAISALSVPVIPACALNTYSNQQHTDIDDKFVWEFFDDEGKTDFKTDILTGSFGTSGTGNFSYEWKGSRETHAKLGWFFDKDSTAEDWMKAEYDYDVTLSTENNASFVVVLNTKYIDEKNKGVPPCLNIIQGWKGEYPIEKEISYKHIGEYTADGAAYDLYSFENPYAYINEFIAIRKENLLENSDSISGSVSLGEHISALQELDLMKFDTVQCTSAQIGVDRCIIHDFDSTISGKFTVNKNVLEINSEKTEPESTISSRNLEDLPSTVEEYNAFIEKYGKVSVHNDCIVYCDEVNYSTPINVELEQSGATWLNEIKNYTIADESEEILDGSPSHAVYVYQCHHPGNVHVQFTNGRLLVADKKYRVTDDFKVSEIDISNIKKGDVNTDGSFDIADCARLQRWILNIEEYESLESICFDAADFNEDGVIDSFDLCQMKTELLKQDNKKIVYPEIYLLYGTIFDVLTDNLEMYAGPGDNYAVIGTVPKGIMLEELAYIDGVYNWAFVNYNGQYGWLKYKNDDGSANLKFSEMQYDKPVIYLYPEEETDVHVEVKLSSGELATTYPKYNNGWDVTAYPDGTLTNKADGTHHKSLFWGSVGNSTKFDFSKGFCVAGCDTESFLKEKLTYMGLTENEMNEFIVYWLPRMEHNKYNLITFQNEAYTDSAELNITPTPDSLCRIFMAYAPLDSEVEIQPQQLETFERKGFTAVEWGGTEINNLCIN